MPKPEVMFLCQNEGQVRAKSRWAKSRLMFLLGPAGTGKTHTALALALMDSLKRKHRIYLSRPLVACDGERMGFLPGNVDEKLMPWLGPFSDVLGEMTTTKLDDLKDRLELVPVGLLRGRTIRDGTLIVDEAQNLTYGQIKCALTRVGKSGRVVLCGDPDQSDRFEPSRSPLADISHRLSALDFCTTVRFTQDQIVREDIISDILDRI